MEITWLHPRLNRNYFVKSLSAKFLVYSFFLLKGMPPLKQPKRRRHYTTSSSFENISFFTFYFFRINQCLQFKHYLFCNCFCWCCRFNFDLFFFFQTKLTTWCCFTWPYATHCHAQRPAHPQTFSSNIKFLIMKLIYDIIPWKISKKILLIERIKKLNLTYNFWFFVISKKWRTKMIQ